MTKLICSELLQSLFPVLFYFRALISEILDKLSYLQFHGMNIDGHKKPFPFLRKGDGLTRYSSLKYPRYKKSYSTGSSHNFASMENDQAEAEDARDDAKDEANIVSPAVGDSGKGSSGHDGQLEDRHSDVETTPKGNLDSPEPSLMDHRIAWDMRERVCS